MALNMSTNMCIHNEDEDERVYSHSEIRVEIYEEKPCRSRRLRRVCLATTLNKRFSLVVATVLALIPFEYLKR